MGFSFQPLGRRGILSLGVSLSLPASIRKGLGLQPLGPFRLDVGLIHHPLFEEDRGQLPVGSGVIRQVVEDDPPSPRRLNGSVPRDLETICAKCLEKKPGQRYATAAELADEVKHRSKVLCHAVPCLVSTVTPMLFRKPVGRMPPAQTITP